MYCEAVTAFGAPLERLERDAPAPVGAEALVTVTGCGLCHSDLHLHDGHFDLGGGAQLPVAIPLPAVLGHEIEGVVAALGPDVASVNPGVKVGDRVAIYPWIGCGQCAQCLRGDQQLCGANRNLGIARWGGFASACSVPDAAALIPVNDLSPGIGGLAMCSGLTAYSAVMKLEGRGAGEPLIVLGLGGVGMTVLAVARALQQGPIIAVDVDAKKREAARARGAAEAIDPSAPDAAAQFAARTGGAFAAIDTVGRPETFGFASAAVRRGGRIVIVGLYGGAVPLPLATVPIRALSIIGSYVGSLAEAKALIELIRAGKIDAPLMETRPLSSANGAFTDLRQGKVLGRIVLTP
jgi:D-arabinose 1-dehydrogenase-like Zn-dependent alcohol dehydrogenase